MQNCTCELKHFENAKIVAGALYTVAFFTAVIPLGIKHQWHRHSANFVVYSGVNDLLVSNYTEAEEENANQTENPLELPPN